MNFTDFTIKPCLPEVRLFNIGAVRSFHIAPRVGTIAELGGVLQFTASVVNAAGVVFNVTDISTWQLSDEVSAFIGENTGLAVNALEAEAASVTDYVTAVFTDKNGIKWTDTAALILNSSIVSPYGNPYGDDFLYGTPQDEFDPWGGRRVWHGLQPPGQGVPGHGPLTTYTFCSRFAWPYTVTTQALWPGGPVAECIVIDPQYEADAVTLLQREIFENAVDYGLGTLDSLGQLVWNPYVPPPPIPDQVTDPDRVGGYTNMPIMWRVVDLNTPSGVPWGPAKVLFGDLQHPYSEPNTGLTIDSSNYANLCAYYWFTNEFTGPPWP